MKLIPINFKILLRMRRQTNLLKNVFTFTRQLVLISINAGEMSSLEGDEMAHKCLVWTFSLSVNSTIDLVFSIDGELQCPKRTL